MSVNIAPVDLSSVLVGSSSLVPFVSKQSLLPSYGTSKPAHAVVLNESGCGLDLQLSGGRQDRVPAGGWRVWELTTADTGVTYTVIYILQNQPVAKLLITLYAPGEVVPDLPILGNSPTGISGLVTTATAPAIQNDGNPPGTSIIEATPSGQGSSSWSMNNDGSGFIQILSVNVLRNILSAVRGTSIAEASVAFGDPSDIAMTTFYGTMGVGTLVPASVVQPGTYPAGNFITHANAGALNQRLLSFVNDAAAGHTWGIVIRTDNGLSISDITSGINVIISTAGNISTPGTITSDEILFNSALSAGNQIMNLQQAYGIFSDNTGAIGTTRNWWDGPDRGELQLGPRTGANFFDWIRLRATRVTINLGKNTSPSSTIFEVTGGPTQLDGNNFATDGTNGTVTMVGGQASAGPLGVPVSVARTPTGGVHCTGALNTTVLSFTPSVNGMYQIHASIRSAATTNGAITLTVNFTDANSSGARTSYFVHGNVLIGAAGAALTDGGLTLTFPNDFPLLGPTVHAKAGSAITIVYQNSSTTTSDDVTAVIIRVD